MSEFFIFLFPFEEDKVDCIKYFSFMSCLYSFTSVERHGLRVSKNTVVKEFKDHGCVRIEGTGECLNQRQGKKQEAVESCVICTANEVLGKSKQGFQGGWICGWSRRPEKTHKKLNWRM
jgi:hypothetical protein